MLPGVGEAFLFGLLASSALVIGGALGSYWQPSTRITGAMLAFASGTLISALAFELFPEAVELGGLRPAGLGLLVGAATFVVINTWLDSRVAPPEEVAESPAAGSDRPGGERGADAEAAATARGGTELPRELAGAAAEQREKVAVASQGVGLALLAAVTLDGVPENLALGVSLAGEQATAEPSTLAFPLALAGGAVLASLADILMPEAFERGRPLNAFATAAGFY